MEKEAGGVRLKLIEGFKDYNFNVSTEFILTEEGLNMTSS